MVVVGLRFDRTVARTFGWKVGESAPRTRGGGFAGEVARGVVPSLVPGRLLDDTVDLPDDTWELDMLLAGLREEAGVALLFIFALGLRVGDGRGAPGLNLTGDTGLEAFGREVGLAGEGSVYVSFTVT